MGWSRLLQKMPYLYENVSIAYRKVKNEGLSKKINWNVGSLYLLCVIWPSTQEKLPNKKLEEG